MLFKFIIATNGAYHHFDFHFVFSAIIPVRQVSCNRPEQEIASVTPDGTFDPRKCTDASRARGAAAITPPLKNAKPWKPATAGRLHATRPCAHQNASAEPSGENGVAITAGVVSITIRIVSSF